MGSEMCIRDRHPGALARPLEARTRGPSPGAVLLMLFVSLAIGIGAGAAAWFFSR